MNHLFPIIEQYAGSLLLTSIEKHAKKMLSQDAEQAIGYALMAFYFYELSQKEKALAAVDQALAQPKINQHSFIIVLTILQQCKASEEQLLLAIHQAISVDPEESFFHKQLAFLDRAETKEIENETLRAYAIALREEPNDAELLGRYSRFLMQQGYIHEGLIYEKKAAASNVEYLPNMKAFSARHTTHYMNEEDGSYAEQSLALAPSDPEVKRLFKKTTIMNDYTYRRLLQMSYLFFFLSVPLRLTVYYFRKKPHFSLLFLLLFLIDAGLLYALIGKASYFIGGYLLVVYLLLLIWTIKRYVTFYSKLKKPNKFLKNLQLFFLNYQYAAQKDYYTQLQSRTATKPKEPEKLQMRLVAVKPERARISPPSDSFYDEIEDYEAYGEESTFSKEKEEAEVPQTITDIPIDPVEPLEAEQKQRNWSKNLTILLFVSVLSSILINHHYFKKQPVPEKVDPATTKSIQQTNETSQYTMENANKMVVLAFIQQIKENANSPALQSLRTKNKIKSASWKALGDAIILKEKHSKTNRSKTTFTLVNLKKKLTAVVKLVHYKITSIAIK
ncbi:hypothetical protein A374_07126 [Fictibacillus macauensis ZFHKF-1]|uniref:Uncharacterized protein n=1 Tax=Fictibacillus macauensis ZFHKF-1 TaxID=1196324 RepID=I8UGZ0_9BACL|nr:hypothetical protein [Fictibacillus macauensis]EIT86073.1 hypothetical protein A374_07126 [Fictibacillus macauensis ZFHKF-1]